MFCDSYSVIMLAPMPLFYGQLWIKNEAIALAVMLIFYRFACPSLSYMLRTLFEARFPLLFFGVSLASISRTFPFCLDVYSTTLVDTTDDSLKIFSPDTFLVPGKTYGLPLG